MPCRLTDAGRDAIAWYIDRVRDGGAAPNRYYVEDNSDFILLGEGNHRVVYTNATSADPPLFQGGEDCVVKCVKFPDPWANRNEIINYEFAPAGVRQYLAPVYDYEDSGLWLTMPRASGGVSQSEADEVAKSIYEQGYYLGDIRPDNMGYIGGEPRVIDYGFRIIKNGTDLPVAYYDPDSDPEHIGPEGEEFFSMSPNETEMERFFG